MTASLYEPAPSFRSRLSFAPLLAAWEETVRKDTGAHTCAAMARRFRAHPELRQPIDDYSLLQQHEALIADAMHTIFPTTMSLGQNLGAAAVPFSNRVVFASALFRKVFMEEHNLVLPLDPQVETNIRRAEVHLAYKLILKQYYRMDLHGGKAFICAYPEAAQDIYNYFELSWDPQFISITNCITPPELPQHILLNCHGVEDLDRFPELRDLLPLEEFIFDGIIIIHIDEVTERETMNSLRNLLQEEDAWEQPGIFNRFKEQVQYLLQGQEMAVGVNVFSNGGQLSLVAPQLQGALLPKPIKKEQQETINQLLIQHFTKASHYTWSRDIKGSTILEAHLQESNWESAIFSAIRYEGTIIGCLEIYSTDQGAPSHKKMALVHAVIQLLEASLQKCRVHLQNKVNRLVMDHFTAVQASVEWRFNAVALNYLYQQQTGVKARMEDIVFSHVYPLYGSVDIRNSSGERNKAVQQDMRYQLQWIRTILQKAKQCVEFPLLDQLLLKTEEQEQSIKDYLFINDEQAVYTFLKQETARMLRQLQDIAPDCRQDIDAYFAALDPDTLTIKAQQRLYEESINRINNHIAHLLESEQVGIQQAYPHYFERYITDGVEFNIYIGQSIAPDKPFNQLHLQNLRLWQLGFLVKVARELHLLSPQLPIPLHTTQLVLVYSDPLSIAFHTAERKFDVEGVYNARYEVVKKRIDKALIRDTNQRLTQPGQIAVVYSGLEEEREYLQYFHYLHTKGLLQGEAEHLELEELQGVSGLKALRVQLVLEESTTPAEQTREKELSTGSYPNENEKIRTDSAL
jgi:hypothetical protein